MRGKREKYQIFGQVGRITPAGAGKTRKSRRSRLEYQDHPRRCGENDKSSFEIVAGYGSPPQVRGKQNKYSVGNTVFGITPAGAGKTAHK